MKKEFPVDTLKKAVIYCRVSTKEQVDEGNSLVSQERICRDYALKEGYEIVEVYVERGESAKTAERTELKRLLAFCTAKKGNAHAVIAYKVDRISRNITDYSQIRMALKNCNVEIKSVTEYFEDTPAGRFMENIIANVGQFDNDVRAERCIGGMHEAVKEGRYVWMAPPGYRNIKINGKSTIEPSGQAVYIREIFELLAKRTYHTDEIRILMNKKGLVNRAGKPIARSYFFLLIRNPLYKGVIRKFGVSYKGNFEPVVPEELFDDVQLALKRGRNKGKHYTHEHQDFPLRRFIVNETGKQLTGYWAKGRRLKYPYYSFGLPGTTIRKEILEKKFAQFLAQFSFDNRHLKVLRKHLEKHFGNHLNKEDEGKKIIESKIDELNAQVDNLIKLRASGSIPMGIFEDRIRKHDIELDEMKRLLKAKHNTVNVTELLEFTLEILKKPYELWLKGSFDFKKRLQRFEFPEGIIFDGVNFRTTQLCSIFKLKKLIEDFESIIVHSTDAEKNNHSDINLPLYDKYIMNTKAYWDNVVEDLSTLKDLLSEK